MTGPAHITNPPVALGGDRPAGSVTAPDGTVRAAAGRRADLVGQGIGRLIADLPRLAVQAAKLPALRRVDPVKAYPLAVYFPGIAVDHRGNSGYVGQGRSGEQAQGSDARTHGA